MAKASITLASQELLSFCQSRVTIVTLLDLKKLLRFEEWQLNEWQSSS